MMIHATTHPDKIYQFNYWIPEEGCFSVRCNGDRLAELLLECRTAFYSIYEQKENGEFERLTPQFEPIEPSEIMDKQIMILYNDRTDRYSNIFMYQ